MTEKLIKWLIYCLVFFTPLLVWGGFSEAFELPKMIFVYLVGGVGAFLLLLHCILNQKNFVKIPPVFWAYLGAILVSTIFSTHFYTSVWGYYIRFTGGLLSTLVYFGVFLAIVNLFQQKRDKNQIVLLLVLTIVPLSFYGLYEKLMTSPERIVSTLGQPNWLAAYLATVLVICFYYVLKSPTKKLKVLFSLILIAGYMCLWWTFSMSGVLGFLGGLCMFSLLNKQLLISNKQWLAGLIIICLTFSVFNSQFYVQRFQDVFIDIKKVYAVEAIAQNNVSDPGYIRLNLWKGTLNLATQNAKTFLIGTGPETFPYEFQKHRPAELNYSSEWDFLINKPHNYYLETLAETGIISLLAYLGIIAYTIKARHKIATPALTALYITNIFGFLVVPTTLLFWILAGLIVGKK